MMTDKDAQTQPAVGLPLDVRVERLEPQRAAFEAWAIRHGARRNLLEHDRWALAWLAWQAATVSERSRMAHQDALAQQSSGITGELTDADRADCGLLSELRGE